MLLGGVEDGERRWVTPMIAVSVAAWGSRIMTAPVSSSCHWRSDATSPGRARGPAGRRRVMRRLNSRWPVAVPDPDGVNRRPGRDPAPADAAPGQDRTRHQDWRRDHEPGAASGVESNEEGEAPMPSTTSSLRDGPRRMPRLASRENLTGASSYESALMGLFRASWLCRINEPGAAAPAGAVRRMLTTRCGYEVRSPWRHRSRSGRR